MSTFFVVPTITVNTPTQFDEQGREVRYNIEIYSESLTVDSGENLNRITYPPLRLHRTDELFKTVRQPSRTTGVSSTHHRTDGAGREVQKPRLAQTYQLQRDGTIIIIVYEPGRALTKDIIKSAEQHRYKIYRLVSSTETIGEKRPELRALSPNNPIWEKKVFESTGDWVQDMTTENIAAMLRWDHGQDCDWCQPEYVTFLDRNSFCERVPTKM